MSLKTFLIFTVVLSFCDSVRIQPLIYGWFFKDTSGRYVDLQATVPGGIYSDLMDRGIIGDIFYGNNDEATRWVARTNWTYYTSFRIGSDILAHENVHLVFDGLDTFANIVVNNVKIGETQNMFVQYIFNAKNALIAGENMLEVQFLSPLEVSENLAREQNRTYNIPPNCPPDEYKGECHVNMIRKLQASFSWDWGPSFPSVGIWKDVYIEAYDNSVIRYIVADAEERANAWVLNVDTYFANNVRQSVVGRASYTLSANSISITRFDIINETPNGYNEIVFTTTLQIPKAYVYTWWPNGYGGQSVYDLTVTYTSTDQTDVSTKTIRVGFRTIELIQETTTGGLTFYFQVNGIPIFAKGTNVIPLDILPERGTDRNRARRVLNDARSANMNMLRVWGGGVYETDYYYDLADELGLLIWQDFMFARSLYPANENYLNNVLDEVRHQVKRIGSHVSIALFSGNAENEGILRSNWYSDQYRQDYVKLYVDTIKNEFNRLTHNRGIFISSSPANGRRSEDEGYVAQQPGSVFYGDVHYYNYYLDSFESSIYPVPRFASGYGFQSLPSVDAFLTATDSISDVDINSAFMQHRQHHPYGNGQLINLINIQFRLPDTRSPNYYKGLIYYTQIIQAVSVRIESEHYRRYRGILNVVGQGNTMGALIGQLNDVWVAPTWSIVDYTGRRKMLHYSATDFFAPMIITGHIDGTRTLQVYAISDIMWQLDGITGSIEVYRWDSFDRLSEDRVNFDMEPGTSHLLSSFNIDSYLAARGCGSTVDARQNCFIYLQLFRDQVQHIGPTNFVLPEKIRYSAVPQANVRITDVRKLDDEGTFQVDISTDKIALFVWLESGRISGNFGNNGFLQISSRRTIYFFADGDENVSEYELQQELTITHLLDPQYFV